MPLSPEKKQILMWIAGTLATLGVSFLVYRMEKRDAATNAANEEAATEAAAQQASAEQSYLATQPSVSVPSISTPAPATTTSDVNTAADNGGATPSSASALEALVTSFLAQENSNVTSQTSPQGIAALPPQAALPVSTSPPDLSQPIGGVTLSGALSGSNQSTGTTPTITTPLRSISRFSTGQ